MLDLLSYLIKQGVATSKELCPDLPEGVRGLPKLTEAACKNKDGTDCNLCAEACPTDAITIFKEDERGKVSLDLGSCIGCGMCVEVCPTGTIVNNPSTRTAVKKRQDLVLSNFNLDIPAPIVPSINPLFRRSVAARVVSTGCSACDMELGAAGNPIFDIERFGITVVASPRFADVLVVTGPVSKGMQAALKSCHEAMSAPRSIIALGTCAISGGVHKGGYADACGVENLLPVSVYIPGCPPHPWSIIYGMLLAMESGTLSKLSSKQAKSKANT
ncbi:MAG: NADH-quinone oxidoreductase subunit NuoB [Candidatus Obscuribacter sp.]|nr:NADH-quinone oxidoreductase subunit NuoB [Candidatus Melainabacteria bacterium]MDX1985985.1 NADH-quinone oxidoreductase subunit NuoB [Candidatus Obscuribacter sp.]